MDERRAFIRLPLRAAVEVCGLTCDQLYARCLMFDIAVHRQRLQDYLAAGASLDDRQTLVLAVAVDDVLQDEGLPWRVALDELLSRGRPFQGGATDAA